MAMTDKQEIVLAIAIVICLKVCFLLCLCKVRRCSEQETTVSLTPGAMCRHLCRKRPPPSGDDVEVASPTPTTPSTIPSKFEIPPPYYSPPQYQEAMGIQTDTLNEEWISEPPPPYTISLPATPSDFLNHDVSDWCNSNDVITVSAGVRDAQNVV